MFQEHGLHAAIGDGADLGVIGRIQIQQREGFGPRNSVKGIALDGLDAVGAGNPRTFGVEFDTVAPNLCVAGRDAAQFLVQRRDRSPKPARQGKQRAQFHSLGLR